MAFLLIGNHAIGHQHRRRVRFGFLDRRFARFVEFPEVHPDVFNLGIDLAEFREFDHAEHGFDDFVVLLLLGMDAIIPDPDFAVR